MLRSCSERFPTDAPTKNGSGLPWGLVYTPLMELDPRQEKSWVSMMSDSRMKSNRSDDAYITAQQMNDGGAAGLVSENTGEWLETIVPRCASCGAYICSLNRVTAEYKWRCVLCGRKNALPQEYVAPALESDSSLPPSGSDSEPGFFLSNGPPRTFSSDAARSLVQNAKYPELNNPNYMVDISPIPHQKKRLGEKPSARNPAGSLLTVAYIFVLDLTLSPEDMAIVVQGISNSVKQALFGSDDVAVGIMTIGGEFIGLLDFSGRHPCIRRIPYSETNDLSAIMSDVEQNVPHAKLDFFDNLFRKEVWLQKIMTTTALTKFSECLGAVQRWASRIQQSVLEANESRSEHRRLRFAAEAISAMLAYQSDPSTDISCSRVFFMLNGPATDVENPSGFDRDSANPKALDEETGDSFRANQRTSSQNRILNSVGLPSISPAAAATAAKASLSSGSSKMFAWLNLGSLDPLIYLARNASRLGVIFDVFAVAKKAVNLSQLFNLIAQSGGRCNVYEDKESMQDLPDDLFRSVTDDAAMRGVMRIRTTPEFQVSKLYCVSAQPMTPLGEKDQVVFAVNLRGSRSTMAVDLEFTQPEGFMGAVLAPTLQIAFRFLHVYKGSDGRMRLRRALRLSSSTYGTAQARSLVQKECDAAVVLKLLFQKALLAHAEAGSDEASYMLRDWLARLLSCGPRGKSDATKSKDSTKGHRLQISALSDYPSLTAFPRLIFGLIKSKLISSDVTMSPDERISLHLLCSSLPVEWLLTCVYPRLIGFTGINDRPSRELALCTKSVMETDYRVFVLDVFSQIFVYYHSTNVNYNEIPPPADSQVGTVVRALCKDRPIKPNVRVCKRDSHTASWFFSYLIEEAPDNLDITNTSTEWSLEVEGTGKTGSARSVAAAAVAAATSQKQKPLYQTSFVDFCKSVEAAADEME